jgi:NAD(P)-dependent dehydrogenase (short-subunit alcohol dehydrogenase family)
MTDAGEGRGATPGRGRLAGRRVLVVGAGQQRFGPDDLVGHGRARSVVFGREGAAVACADINGDAAAETAAAVRDEGAMALAITADGSAEDDVRRMIAEVVDGFGGIDGVVLNLGIGGSGRLLEQTPAEDWDRVFAVNVRSHFLCCKHVLPVMADGGAIVLVSSIAALIAVSDKPAYNASKAALSGLCHAAAKEAAPRGVRVNVLVPGLIDTPLGRRASAGRPERATTPIPLGRQGTAWDVAAAALFLVSDDAAYVTGQSLVVDGGLTTLR